MSMKILLYDKNNLNLNGYLYVITGDHIGQDRGPFFCEKIMD
jgi:hypothetical protein